MLKTGFLISLLGLAGFVINSCDASASAETQPALTEPIGMNVNIKLFTFKPNMLEVPVGTTIVWTNQDAVEHTVTNGTPENPTNIFDSNGFKQGETFSFTFTEAGDYSYFCERHNFMRGQIKVIPAP